MWCGKHQNAAAAGSNSSARDEEGGMKHLQASADGADDFLGFGASDEEQDAEYVEGEEEGGGVTTKMEEGSREAAARRSRMWGRRVRTVREGT
jgi:hypothetical protein